MSLTAQQIGQVRVLLESLSEAKHNLVYHNTQGEALLPTMRILNKDEKIALTALEKTKARIETGRDLSGKDLYDLETNSLSFGLDNRERNRIKEVLKNAFPQEPNPKLSSFGKVPWTRIEAAFTAAGVECPIAFKMFHAEYFKRHSVLSNLRETVSVSSKRSK